MSPKSHATTRQGVLKVKPDTSEFVLPRRLPNSGSTIFLSKLGSSMLINKGAKVSKEKVTVQYEEPKEHKIVGALTAYRERGKYLHRLEQFRKAKAAYDEAYIFAPENIDLLIGRSKTCISAMHPDLALEDTDAALELDPGNIRALHAEAKAMAVKRQFERSVLLNYQGLQRRRQPPYFAEGISDGIHCIEEAIGKQSGQVLLEFLPLIKSNSSPVFDEHALNTVKRESRIPKPKYTQKVTQLEAHKHKVLSRVLAYKYLGPMAEEKFFLENLLTDPRINSANSAGSKKIKEYIISALDKIDTRQEVLREQRPYYAIKHAERTESKHETKHKKEILIKERHTNECTATQMVKKVEDSMRACRTNDMMTQAKRMQMFLDSKSTYTFPNKQSFVDRLYRAIGEGYLNQYRLSYRISDRGNRRRIAFLMGIRVGRATSFDSVMANYPRSYVDPRENIKKYLADLEVCESPSMKCWLYYELARLMCTVKNYVMSKTYAKLCQREAENLQSAAWWLNGCFALISGDMQQGNCNEVKELAAEAIEWAKLIKQSRQVIAFLELVAEMSGSMMGIDEKKAIAARENEILDVLVDPEIKEEVKYLFRRMARVPVGRRFSVMALKEESSNSNSERRKHHQGHLSVIPGPPRRLPKLGRTVVPGLQMFEM